MNKILPILKYLNPKWILFSEDQRLILKECKIANKEDSIQWVTKNVIYPIIIIGIPLFIQIFFVTEVKDFKKIIFNGSISLIGVNILFGMSTYLIKVNRIEKTKSKDSNKEKDDFTNERIDRKLNQNVIYLRSRLGDYTNFLVIVGGVFYLLQTLFVSYNSDLLYYIFIVFTFIILYSSICIGRYMFIIKDDFFEKTFYSDMKDGVNESKNRWEVKY